MKRKAEYSKQTSQPHIRFTVTPNCNLFCKACQPGGESYTKPCYYSGNHFNLITPKEVGELAKIATDIGFSPIKITGGEPLTRDDIPEIIAECKKIPSAIVNLGTNGLRLVEVAQKIKDAGVDSLNVGINTLNKEVFFQDTGVDGLEKVLDGIRCARRLNIPVNVNIVLMKHNFREFGDYIKLAEQEKLNLRIIPLSNLGNYNYWHSNYISCSELESYLVSKYGIKRDLVQPWSGLGTPMSTFNIHGAEIRIINPGNGVFYSTFCRNNKCGNFPCTDGIWALRIEPDGSSKYCFSPKSGRETINYLNMLRKGEYGEIQKHMKDDFDILNSAKIEKLWNVDIEKQKYSKATK